MRDRHISTEAAPDGPWRKSDGLSCLRRATFQRRKVAKVLRGLDPGPQGSHPGSDFVSPVRWSSKSEPSPIRASHALAICHRRPPLPRDNRHLAGCQSRGASGSRPADPSLPAFFRRGGHTGPPFGSPSGGAVSHRLTEGVSGRLARPRPSSRRLPVFGQPGADGGKEDP